MKNDLFSVQCYIQMKLSSAFSFSVYLATYTTYPPTLLLCTQNVATVHLQQYYASIIKQKSKNHYYLYMVDPARIQLLVPIFRLKGDTQQTEDQCLYYFVEIYEKELFVQKTFAGYLPFNWLLVSWPPYGVHYARLWSADTYDASVSAFVSFLANDTRVTTKDLLKTVFDTVPKYNYGQLWESAKLISAVN